MDFRYARHTNNLEPLIRFYKDIIGLEQLGGFKDHAGYDGVFIGLKDASWHLEFTTSRHAAKHQPDDDDLLVFYFSTDAELQSILQKARANNIHMPEPKNPYWKTNGHVLTTPMGLTLLSPEKQLHYHQQTG